MEGESSPGIRIVPPLLFAGAMAVGAGVEWLIPFDLGPVLLRFGVAGGLILVGVVIVVPFIVQFRRAKTPFDVRRPATQLITGGLLRYSRNPGYLALVLLSAGISLLAYSGWMLVATGAAAIYLDRVTIMAEERHLEASFGDDYRAYRGRVRRWL